MVGFKIGMEGLVK